ncbi:MAG: efflux transporter outer membrane subunit [Bradyrhizobium sp.]|uniref:efflux transporter outer membrane subunit n=1 Tax=Bradyrhizobium sp. TaxID=376 RepID=UPI001C286547|nr:efflux transporter outer membrane subunit [Bradyrhizobium sp.]MBU6463259.1 efflux transporter outer membrane subunit [Pseudomonadota bacterium]MDE2066618.1 efflux transporter outer membrane subunit [Bradyrhizobium sp.]MDE2243672.1 efflux transporter outer membrane subunit [Bradyrhizobium sp.]MDE2467987.1 efflux transporter outer membrane subunit [Bradyrhizobium sp.]
MRLRSLAFLVLFAVALTGCALGPQYFTPDAALPTDFVTMPGGNGLKSGSASLDPWQWWRTLHDPELNRLIDIAILNNQDLKIALDRLQQARLQSIVIGARAVPQLNGSAGGGVGTGTDETKGRAAQALRDGDNGTGLKKISGIGGLDAEWEIDIFGKIASRLEAQAYTADALKEARDWVYVVVAADVARLYFDLRSRQARLRILYRGIDAARKVVDLAQARLDQGLTNELDVLLAKREVASAEAEVGPLKAQIAANAYAIAVLVGDYPENLTPELQRAGAVPHLPASAPLGTPVDLLRRRPDVREAERHLAAAVADIDARTADLFPSLALTAGAGAQVGPKSGSAIPITWLGSVGPTLDAAILDFGALDAKIEIADYHAHELAAAYKQTILVAVEQVDEAYATYQGFRLGIRHLDTAIDAARQATKVVTKRYDSGLTDFLNVLDAARQQFLLEQRRAEIIRLAGDSFVALHKALGGGWPLNEVIPPLRHPDPAVIAAVKRLAQDPPRAQPPLQQ